MYVALKGKLIPHCKNQTQPCPNVETAHCSYNIQRTTSYIQWWRLFRFLWLPRNIPLPVLVQFLAVFTHCWRQLAHLPACTFRQLEKQEMGNEMGTGQGWEQDRDGNRIGMGTGTGTRTKKLRNTTMGFKFHLQFGPVTQRSTLGNRYQKRAHMPTLTQH